jgi:hypothetical protein
MVPLNEMDVLELFSYYNKYKSQNNSRSIERRADLNKDFYQNMGKYYSLYYSNFTLDYIDYRF